MNGDVGENSRVVRGCQDCLNGPHRHEREGATFAVSLIDQRIITQYGTCDFCHHSDVIVATFTRKV